MEQWPHAVVLKHFALHEKDLRPERNTSPPSASVLVLNKHQQEASIQTDLFIYVIYVRFREEEESCTVKSEVLKLLIVLVLS